MTPLTPLSSLTPLTSLLLLCAECGGWQTGEGGAISSPNYPSSYPSPSRCAWLLEAPEGHTITVSSVRHHTHLCDLILPETHTLIIDY